MPTQVTEIQLKRLKEELPLYRRILGYSAEKFGGFLGLKRQQISSLETGRTTLTRVHFRAIVQVINETIGEKLDNNEINIALFVIQVLIGVSEEYLNDEEYLHWRDILVQFSKLGDVGSPENQVKLLKGFAIASKDLNKGDVVPSIELLDDIIEGFREYMQKMNNIINNEQTI